MSRGPRVLLAVLALVPWVGHRIMLATDRPPNEIVLSTRAAGTPSHTLGRALSERWAESAGLTVLVGPSAGDTTPIGLVLKELADLALTPEPVPLEDPVAPVLSLRPADGGADQELWAADSLDPRVVAVIVDDLREHGGALALELEVELPTDQARSAHPGAVGVAVLDGGLEGFLGRHGGAAVSVVLLLVLALSSRRASTTA
jgi:hypothetical protein